MVAKILETVLITLTGSLRKRERREVYGLLLGF